MSELLITLQQKQLITVDQARVVRIESARSQRGIAAVLNDFNICSASELNLHTHGSLDIDIDPESFIPDTQAVKLLNETDARQYNVLPVVYDAEQQLLTLAVDDEVSLIVRDRLRRLVTAKVDLAFRRAEAGDIKRSLDKCYGASHLLSDIIADLEVASLASVKGKESNQASVVRLVDAILQNAVTRRASDVHLSPEGISVIVRYRIDGVLVIACCLHRCYWSAMLVRLKVLAGIDIAETRLPQDGHMARMVNGQRINFRVSSFPIREGENMVLRVLDRRWGIRTLDALCNSEPIQTVLESMVKRPNGLVVVGGPTGSGKTTTLYAMLGALNTDELNIMTLEDPVEYPLANVRQTRVQGNSAFGFADGVRGLLRQDPDVILIGEIRDKDSCLMACRAAMTGHLVLTSTHADNCMTTITRLLELGAQRSVLAEVLNGVVSQRLFRKTCQHCLGQSAVCGVCAGVGYSGRFPLFECLSVGRQFKDLLSSSGSREALQSQAEKDGMNLLWDSAQEQAGLNRTTAKEVVRVLGERELHTA